MICLWNFNIFFIYEKGISFDDRSFHGADDGLNENTPLIDTQEQPYRPIRTTGFIIFHIILTVTSGIPSSYRYHFLL